jgi:soluble lytic murein transglycosylase-like protein
MRTSIFLLCIFLLTLCIIAFTGCDIDAALSGVNPNTLTPTVTSTPIPDYRVLARQVALQANIPPQYFVNQIQVASNFDPNAMGPDGEIGIAQWMPDTARGLGINPHDPVQSIQGAARMMGTYYQTYGKDYAKSLAAYNTGSGTLNNALARCGVYWQSCIPASTNTYIKAVMGG